METIKATDYGVQFDGVTDDYSNLQTAVNASVGKHLILPSGTALLSQCIVLPSNIKVSGVWGQTFLKPTNGNTSAPALIDIDSEEYVEIEHVGFDGNLANISGFETVVSVSGSTNIRFNKCLWRNTKGIGVLFSDCAYSGVEWSDFKDCGIYNLTSSQSADRRQAIAFTNGGISSSGRGRDNFTRHNKFKNTGLDSISVGKGTGLGELGFDVSHNKIDTGYAGSIYIAGARSFNCLGNVVTNGSGGGNGIDVFFSNNGVIANNICDGNGAAGILLADVDKVTVANNVCKNNWQGGTSTHKGGITLHAPGEDGRKLRNVTITGNVCDDDQANTTQFYGVYVVGDKYNFGRVRIDNSNHLVGRDSSGAKVEERALYNPDAISVTEFPQVFTLDNNGTRTLNLGDVTRGQLIITQLNSSYFCLATLRYQQSPDQQLDPSSHYANSDSGSGVTALYRSSTTTNTVLKNRTGSDGRVYMVSAIGLVDRD